MHNINIKPLMDIPVRESMEIFEKIINVFGYVSIPGICQTAAAVRAALAVTQFAMGAISAGYHEAKALWSYYRHNDKDTYLALRERVKEDLKWIEHAVLNVMRAVVEFFNFGWPVMVLLALWDNLDLRISHRNGVSPFTQVAEKIDFLQAKLSISQPTPPPEHMHIQHPYAPGYLPPEFAEDE